MEKPAALMRPSGCEEDFIARLEYRDPIQKASVWLHRHLIRIIRLIEQDKPWYLGETRTRPEQLLSEMFELKQNTLCDRFRHYSDQLLLYKPGHVPFDIISKDRECLRILIARLYWYCRDTELIRKLAKTLETFWLQMTKEELFEDPEYGEKLKGSIREMTKVFGSLSEYFANMEASLSKPQARLAEVAGETLEIVRETHAAVERMDARDKRARRNARLKFSDETQERVYAIWERGRMSPEVKKLAKSGKKASYENVFTHSACELRELGIVNAALFKACLGARSDRLRRNAARRIT